MAEKTAELRFDQDEMLRLDHQMCFPIYACARRVTGLYTPFLKPLNITYTQYLVFLVLWEQDGIGVGDLCRKLYLDSGTITPLLKKMEEHGFIRRLRCPDDERCVKIKLTEKGRQMKLQAAEIPMKVGACMRLEPEEAAEFYRLTYKILGSLE